MKRIILLTTGGTVAMTASGEGDGGRVSMGAADLLASAADLVKDLDIEGRNILAKPSASLSFADLRLIAEHAAHCATEADGVVITHGTDTLAETAFALSLVLTTATPIVLTGAMRRSDQPGADGVANILAACRVAAAPQARGKGVLTVFGDEIHAAAFVAKTHSFRPHAFQSFAPLGWIAEDRVRFFCMLANPLPHIPIGVCDPIVPLIEIGHSFDPIVLSTLAQGPFDGLVIAAAGAGHVAASAVPVLAELAQRMPIVFASRTGDGETLRHTYAYEGSERDLIKIGLIPAGWLSPRKARLALMLALSQAMALDDLRSLFDRF